MGRTAVISDVHANLAALQAVISHARSNDQNWPDEFWFLGDLMGYGPWPTQVWNTLSSLPIPKDGWLAGNHEWGILGKLTNLTLIRPDKGRGSHEEVRINQFRDMAWEIIQLHRKIMDGRQDILLHLKSLPVMSSPRPGIYLAHGDIHTDLEDGVTRYMRKPTDSPQVLQKNFINIQSRASRKVPHSKTRKKPHPLLFCFGHTHIPGMWRWDASKVEWQTLDLLQVVDFEDLAKAPLALNPGSVGFPRGIHRCPSYMLIDWDLEKIFFQRVSYDPKPLLEEMSLEPYSKLIGESGFWRDPECREHSDIHPKPSMR